jgi:hypothetical protein
MDRIPFSPAYTLSSDEIFRVPNYVLPKRYAPLLVTPVDVPSVDPARIEQDTRAMVCMTDIDGKPNLLFQRFERSQVLQRNGWISVVLKHDEFDVLDDNVMQFRGQLDAVFDGTDLYFRSAHLIRGFLDVGTLFEEASNSDLQRFCEHKLFSPAQNDLATLCTNEMRKRVMAALQLGILDNPPALTIQEHAQKFGLDLEVVRNVEGDQIVRPTARKELKLLLKLLNDDLLESPVTSDRYSVNSKLKV